MDSVPLFNSYYMPELIGELVVAALLEPRRPEQAMVGQAVED